MVLSRLERETIICWNEEEITASVYTTSPTKRRQLTKRFRRGPDRFGALWAEWIVPKKWITLPRRKDPTNRHPTAGRLIPGGKLTVNAKP